jgi:hypothetical protein
LYAIQLNRFSKINFIFCLCPVSVLLNGAEVLVSLLRWSVRVLSVCCCDMLYIFIGLGKSILFFTSVRLFNAVEGQKVLPRNPYRVADTPS